MAHIGSMETIRGYKFRLYPSTPQEEALGTVCGVCRLIFNIALEQRITFGRAHRIGCHDQIRELKHLRSEFDWIAAVSQTAQTQTLMDLDRAFQNFFAGRARFPRFRRKGLHDSFRIMGREIALRKLNRRWMEIRLPKIGWVRLRATRNIAGTIRNITVSRDALGWSASISCKVELHTPGAPEHAEPVGIDRGVTVPLMLSDGRSYHLPASLASVEMRHRRAQRAASRKTRGSMRHRRALERARKLKARAARIRRHWQHETTTDIARRYPGVVIEALKTRNMSRSARGTAEAPGRGVAAKSGLNRAILNVGWFEIARQLGYKLEERAGWLRERQPHYTSQDCSDCGARDHRSRKSQAVFECTTCGAIKNADLNAALNILGRDETTASEHGVDAREKVGIGRTIAPRTMEPSGAPKGI